MPWRGPQRQWELGAHREPVAAKSHSPWAGVPSHCPPSAPVQELPASPFLASGASQFTKEADYATPVARGPTRAINTPSQPVRVAVGGSSHLPGLSREPVPRKSAQLSLAACQREKAGAHSQVHPWALGSPRPWATRARAGRSRQPRSLPRARLAQGHHGRQMASADIPHFTPIPPALKA